jgi:hypothetical protein
MPAQVLPEWTSSLLAAASTRSLFACPLERRVDVVFDHHSVTDQVQADKPNSHRSWRRGVLL